MAQSDNGSQYTSYAYTERLKQAGIAPSRGRTGTALDNAMAESVMSTLKRGLTKRHTWKTRLDLELAVVSYIAWYNARRRHRSLTEVVGGRIRRLSPLEALERYYQVTPMRSRSSLLGQRWCCTSGGRLAGASSRAPRAPPD